MTAGEWGREFRETLAYIWDKGGDWFAYFCVGSLALVFVLKYWPWRKGPKSE